MFVMNRMWREASLRLYLRSCDYKSVCTCFFQIASRDSFSLLRIMNVVKTLILVLLVFFLFFFQEKVLKFCMHLGIMDFLSSIEIHLLKVT